jgi:hypothetical protein
VEDKYPIVGLEDAFVIVQAGKEEAEKHIVKNE